MKYARKFSGILAVVSGVSLFVMLQGLLHLSESSAQAEEGNSLPPVIVLEPETLVATQPPDSVVSHTLNIHNMGNEVLAWHVYDGAISLWDQTDNVSAGNAAPSQYFPDFDEAGYAADDFVVPAGQTWQVNQILIPGIYADNDELAPNFDVTIYDDVGGAPGTLVVSTTVYPTSDISGEVTLDLVSPLSIASGSHWLSVNANALFGASQTQWFWRTRTVQSGAPYHWLETSGIFATPCIGVWQPGAAVCGTGGGVDPDLVFRLQGFYPEANCDALSELPWVDMSPSSGNVAASSTVTATVGFDSSGYGPGVYTGTLCIASNDPSQSLASVFLTMTVALDHGVMLTADAAATGLIGTERQYDLWLTNTGMLADVYTISVSSQWTMTLATNNLSLAGLATAPVSVTVMIPANALDGEMDVAVVTATSQANPALSDSVTLSTTALVPNSFVYLPFVRD